jgi:hypothetical protein
MSVNLKIELTRTQQAVLQHVYIGSAADDEDFMSGGGYVAFPVEDIAHTPTPEMAA